MSQRNVKNVSHWLIRRAAHRAPESLSQRLEEEWLADMEERRTPLSQLRFAVGCCWATRVIAYERQPSRVAASAAVIEAKGVLGIAQNHVGNFSRRSGTLFLVASLHAALIYGLITALVYQPNIKVPHDLENRQLTNPTVRERLPTFPEPMWDHAPPVPVPPTDLVVPQDPDPSNDVQAKTGEEPLSPMPLDGPPPHVATVVQGGPGVGFPNTNDFYPDRAIRASEQGAATVQVCVDLKGRLTSEPVALQGSGFALLDEAALKLARAGSGRYRPSTEDGKPVNSCYPLRIRFQLHQ